MNTFATLGVKKPFIQSIKELGINSPSEIQEKAIPILLGSSTDFVGLAQTGTGKTAAFGLPIVQQVDPNSEVVQALILSPTRELVQQIKKQLFKYTKYYNFFDFVTLYLIDNYNIYIKNKTDLYIDPIQKKFFSKI